MHPMAITDLARLHSTDLRRHADDPATRLRRARRDAEPERYPLPPFPRLIVGRLVGRLRAVARAGAGA